MTERPPLGDSKSEVGSGASLAHAGAGATGKDLREQREELGIDLADIAEALCIRREFLEALEAGDSDALPGLAYGVGFVRTYANYLGLDGDKLAWQFKIEVSGEAPTAQLDLLTPVQESRIPRGAIVLVTLLLAVAVYGVWYYMNERDLTFADIIPEVPLQFGGTGAPAPKPGAPKPGAEVKKLPSPPKSAGDAGSGSSASGAAEKVAEMPPQGETAGGATTIVTETAAPAANAAVGDQETASPPAETVPAPAAEPVPANDPPVAVATVVPPVAQTVPETPAVSPAPVEAAALPSPAAPAPAPAPVGTNRIEIRATVDAWVQVRTKEGTLLVTRILHRGTSYAVPPQKGLRLTTGNAGGLKIFVDGVAVPALGPFGAVRRDVALDPERLMSGTALAR